MFFKLYEIFFSLIILFFPSKSNLLRSHLTFSTCFKYQHNDNLQYHCQSLLWFCKEHFLRYAINVEGFLNTGYWPRNVFLLQVNFWLKDKSYFGSIKFLCLTFLIHHPKWFWNCTFYSSITCAAKPTGLMNLHIVLLLSVETLRKELECKVTSWCLQKVLLRLLLSNKTCPQISPSFDPYSNRRLGYKMVCLPSLMLLSVSI